MFGLFRSPRVQDGQLGELTRSRGLWRGTIALPSGTSVPLAVFGSRAAPDAQALALARDVAVQLPAWRPAIAAALFEHYEPYREAQDAGELESSGDAFPPLETPEQVWDCVNLFYVAVTPLDGVLTTEVAYNVAWDEEHMLAARFQAGRLVELCGSVVPP